MKQNYTSILRRTLSAVLLLMLSTFTWAQDYDFESGVIWYNINEDGTSVTAAGNSIGLSDVVIPSTVVYEGKTYRVTAIGADAFSRCTSLSSIVIPDGVTSIGEYAFFGCTSLSFISLPTGLTSIEFGAFMGCTSLSSVSLPEGLTSIGGSAFSGCTSLSSISLPTGLTSIDEWVFRDCTSLTSVALPTGVTSIGYSAFSDCISLTSVYISSSVTNIEKQIFDGCASLTSITVSPDNPVYDSRESCNAIIDTRLNELIAGCKSTVIPASVMSIGEWAFCGCTSLTSISLPDGLTSIGAHAFFYCTSLTTVVCRAEAVPTCVYEVFYSVSTSEATLYVPASALEDYKAADQWKDFGTILPLDDYETGIDTPASSLESGTATAPYYTLDGRRVTAPVRGGVYVRGGRKVIVR